MIPATQEPVTVEVPQQQASGRLIVALDFPSGTQALAVADALHGVCGWVKVGMELYYSAGNRVVEQLRARGFEVFLDLKLYDIPNTVAGAVRSVTSAGASLLTIHAGGGLAMMQAAADAAAAPKAPRLLAVTVVTSMDEGELRAVGVSGPADGTLTTNQVLRLSRLARSVGIEGLVCSAKEVAAVRAAMGAKALLVIPGIRPAGSVVGDQRRVATPASAIADGASMLVVGRPITQAPDPAAAAKAILEEIGSADAKARG